MSNVAVIKKPELVEIGNRSISVNGWRYDLAEEHIKWHSSHKNKACSVECMARTMFSRNTPTNCDKVRKNMSTLFRRMLDNGMFMLIEYDHSPGGRGKIKAAKIFDRENASDKDIAEATYQIERMVKRKQISESKVSKALEILNVE